MCFRRQISQGQQVIVKYSYLVKMRRIFGGFGGFYVANSGRKGPVLIDIPIDVQNAQLLRRFQYPEKVSLRTYKPTVKTCGTRLKMKRCRSWAKRPVICAGGGVLLCGTGAFAGVFSQIPCAGRNNNDGDRRDEDRG